ncbi:MAG: 16S rRNA (guanine(966)-N(2))-methyltransferase RsmD [Nitrospirae bacterium]|nr:MAG: 16S rRNA (guanine(966)-N(2))-methyltransferase RsmD [Nitrospirota bacterium]
MRLSGGVAKGRRLAVKGGDVRPTAAKVREAIFNIIGPRIEGSTFLDLYAGTGAVGLDALSRGAESAVFVELNRIRANLIKTIAMELGFSKRVQVFRLKAYTYLKKISEERKGFDYIFVDPPYHSEETMKVLPLIGDGGLLNENGMLIVEHFSKRELPERVGRLRRVKTYRYGDTSLTTYRYT